MKKTTKVASVALSTLGVAGVVGGAHQAVHADVMPQTTQTAAAKTHLQQDVKDLTERSKGAQVIARKAHARVKYNETRVARAEEKLAEAQKAKVESNANKIVAEATTKKGESLRADYLNSTKESSYLLSKITAGQEAVAKQEAAHAQTVANNDKMAKKLQDMASSRPSSKIDSLTKQESELKDRIVARQHAADEMAGAERGAVKASADALKKIDQAQAAVSQSQEKVKDAKAALHLAKGNVSLNQERQVACEANYREQHANVLMLGNKIKSMEVAGEDASVIRGLFMDALGRTNRAKRMLNNVKADIVESQKALAPAQAALEVANKALAQNEAALKDAQENYNNFKAEIVSIKHSVQKAQANLAEAKAQLSDVQGQLAAAKKDAKAQESLRADYLAGMKQAGQELAKIETAKKNIAALESKRADVEKHNDELRAKIFKDAHAQRQLREAKAELAKLDAEITSREQVVKTMKQELTNAKIEAKKADAEVAHLLAHLSIAEADAKKEVSAIKAKEEAKKAEAAKEAARKAEEAKKAEAAKQAEAAKKAEEAKKAEQKKSWWNKAGDRIKDAAHKVTDWFHNIF